MGFAEVDIVSIEWGTEAPADQEGESRLVGLRYYVRHPEAQPAQLIDMLHWSDSPKQALREALLQRAALRPTIDQLMWRSPHFDPRAVDRAPLLAPKTALVYYGTNATDVGRGDSEGFGSTRAFLGTLMRGDTALLGRYDEWSAQVMEAMRARNEHARAFLQLGEDREGGMVAAAYANPRRRGFQTHANGFYLDADGRHVRHESFEHLEGAKTLCSQCRGSNMRLRASSANPD